MASDFPPPRRSGRPYAYVVVACPDWAFRGGHFNWEALRYPGSFPNGTEFLRRRDGVRLRVERGKLVEVQS